MSYIEKLGNGLTYVVEEMKERESASISIWIGAGSRYESPEINGISHFIEHLLFKGTKKRESNQKISEEIEGIGGNLNGFTSKEATCYLAKVPGAHLSTGLDVLADMVINSLFEESSIENERGVIIEEIRMSRDRPDHWVHILLESIVWPDQPMGRSIAGPEDVIRKITKEDIINYMNDLYVPSNIIVTVAGAVKDSDIEKKIREYFDDGSGEKKRNWEKATFKPDDRKVVVEKMETKQASLAIGLPAYDRFHDDRYGLDLLNIVLGYGMSSRLFQEIRVKRGLAYSVGSQFSTYLDTGLFKVYAGVDPEKTLDTAKVVIEQLERLQKEGVNESELSRAKEFYKGSMLLRLEDTMNHAIWMGDSQLFYGKQRDKKEIIEKVDSVTNDDIKRIAGEIIRRENLRIAAVGPFGGDMESSFMNIIQ